MSLLSQAELEGMFYAVKNVLAKMVNEGGRNTEKDLFGCKGGYKTILSKNTVGKPCPVCSTTIKKDAYHGGSIYYWELCQTKWPGLNCLTFPHKKYSIET